MHFTNGPYNEINAVYLQAQQYVYQQACACAYTAFINMIDVLRLKDRPLHCRMQRLNAIKHNIQHFNVLFLHSVCVCSVPVCLLRRCVTRGTGEGEEPFPRGRKRAAPFTVRKFSLMLRKTTVKVRLLTYISNLKFITTKMKQTASSDFRFNHCMKFAYWCMRYPYIKRLSDMRLSEWCAPG